MKGPRSKNDCNVSSEESVPLEQLGRSKRPNAKRGYKNNFGTLQVYSNLRQGGRYTPKKNYTCLMKKFLIALFCISLLTGCVQTDFDSDPNEFIEPLP
jgi:hypothetical protein